MTSRPSVRRVLNLAMDHHVVDFVIVIVDTLHDGGGTRR